MQRLTLLLCIFLAGCISNTTEIAPRQFHRDFFKLPVSEQVRQFHEYDLETQYELLIVGNQVAHPPAFYLTTGFAAQGESVISFLTDKLDETRSDLTVRDIVAVLAKMQHLQSYDVGNDVHLMTLVEERVAAMRSQWKPVTQRMVEEIRGVREAE